MITKSDIPGLRRLWQQAFGDTDAFLDIFFRNGFSIDRCRCIHRDEKIVAALYWFDCHWNGKKIAYIYAVATDQAYRGQGLCRRLMEATHTQLQSEGYAGAVLVPVDRDLSHMYAKFGYRCFCPVQKAVVSEIGNAETISPAEYWQLRKSYLGKNAVLQDLSVLEYLAAYGAFYKTPEGIFCGYRDGDTFHFEEILGELPLRQDAFSEAMYLSLENDPKMPDYFAIPLN